MCQLTHPFLHKSMYKNPYKKFYCKSAKSCQYKSSGNHFIFVTSHSVRTLWPETEEWERSSGKTTGDAFLRNGKTIVSNPMMYVKYLTSNFHFSVSILHFFDILNSMKFLNYLLVHKFWLFNTWVKMDICVFSHWLLHIYIYKTQHVNNFKGGSKWQHSRCKPLSVYKRNQCPHDWQDCWLLCLRKTAAISQVTESPDWVGERKDILWT